jgi:hypothetical protein
MCVQTKPKRFLFFSNWELLRNSQQRTDTPTETGNGFVLFQNFKQCVLDDRLNKADCAVLCVVVARLDWIT